MPRKSVGKNRKSSKFLRKFLKFLAVGAVDGGMSRHGKPQHLSTGNAAPTLPYAALPSPDSGADPIANDALGSGRPERTVIVPANPHPRRSPGLPATGPGPPGRKATGVLSHLRHADRRGSGRR